MGKFISYSGSDIIFDDCPACDFNNHLFSGDVLFYESIGRTDLLEGNEKDLFNSIKTLYKLNNDTIIYPGHGKNTTIKHEKEFNPFIRG